MGDDSQKKSVELRHGSSMDNKRLIILKHGLRRPRRADIVISILRNSENK